MANPKRKKKQAFSIQAFDNAHYKASDAYAAIIERLFDRCTDIIAAASAKGEYNADKAFAFADYPQLKAVMLKATSQLASQMTTTIETGTRKQWEYANKKCDAFLESIMDTSKLSKKQMEQMQTRSLEGLKTFQTRKVNGMDLSQRVWKYVGQYREQMEDALDVGLGEGKNYRSLAKDLKQNLREPNRLFRRVRDKRGNLQLSKNAAAYHPGQGVYRSSVKNAQRLARSEVNMAYREADWQRWQDLDFVVGYEVERSNWRDDKNREYECKICERLKGKYPKTFKFVGWHPQCRCHCIPIMADYFSEEASNDRVARLRSALYGTKYKKYVPKETITDMPQGYKNWEEETIEKLQSGKMSWKNTPYFIRDNYKNGNIENGLLATPRKPDDAPLDDIGKTLSQLSKEEQTAIRNRIANLVLDPDLENACYHYGVSVDHWHEMADKVHANPDANWRMVDDCDAEKARLEAECDRRCASDKDTAQRLIDQLRDAIQECKRWDVGAATGAENALKSLMNYIARQNGKRWGNYASVIGVSCQGQIKGVNDAIMLAKASWDDVKMEAANMISLLANPSVTAKLASLAAETPSVARPASAIAKDIIDEIENLNRTIKAGNPATLSATYDKLVNKKVDAVNVAPLKKPLSEEEIIQKVGGGDETSGSCASVALAYAANKCGLDVSDYRGGDSRLVFANNETLDAITEYMGGVVISRKNDFDAASELMGMMKEGKEYYFGVGKHVAIVRKTATGYEYLELQSPDSNGFKPLTNERLRTRFGCQYSHSSGGVKYGITSELIEVHKMLPSAEFKKLLAYLNTARSKQKKGTSGSPK